MPTKPKGKESLEAAVGAVSEELEVPVASEVVFRKIWRIKHFHKTIGKRDLVDSPQFKCSVNGMSTFWNMSVRFWKGRNGKKVTNPVVVCLNLTGCMIEENGQARVRFQFGVWDASIKHWECCPISSVVLNLQNTTELLSVGYKSLGILDRHLDSSKDVSIMLKLQIIQSDEEVHSLSQDMARLLAKNDKDKDTIICCHSSGDDDDEETAPPGPVRAHSWIIRTRSPKLWAHMGQAGAAGAAAAATTTTTTTYKLDLTDVQHGVATELVRYIYTDKVDNAEAHAAKLLPLSVRFQLPGLTALCERTLLGSLTPSNVANILLLSDQCGCDNLRKAVLHYCEDSEGIKDSFHAEKTLAWRVMEMVNPDLFLEACETFGSSSSNLDSHGTTGSWSD